MPRNKESQSCYNPYTPCQCPRPLPIIFKSSAQTTTSLNAGIITQVQFPQVIIDNVYYSSDLSVYTAPKSGSFSLSAVSSWSTALPHTVFTLYIMKNGIMTNFTTATSAGAVGRYTTMVTGCLPLEKGDVVSVSALATSAVSILGSNPCPRPLTYFEGKQLC